MAYYKTEEGQVVEAWVNKGGEASEPFPKHFGTLGEVPDSKNNVDVILPSGERYTVGPNYAVVLESGRFRPVMPGLFKRMFTETDEAPPETLREEFERRVLEQPHPGEQTTGTEGKARQGAKFVGGEAGRDKESADRTPAGGVLQNEGVDPSGTVPGAPLGASPGDRNTGGSPHKIASEAAQPELVQRGTDAKVEDPARPALERDGSKPGSGPEATPSKVEIPDKGAKDEADKPAPASGTKRR